MTARNKVLALGSHSSRKECVIKILFSNFSTKTYVVGTQKNGLNETVLLSTQNICLKWRIRKYHNFDITLKMLAYLDL